MNESEFHVLADATLARLSAALEKADADGDVEMEYESGVVTIEFPSGKQLLISKHAPTRQLWLSSPISGGLHFSYDNTANWAIPDGKTLPGVLAQELQVLAGIEVIL